MSKRKTILMKLLVASFLMTLTSAWADSNSKDVARHYVYLAHSMFLDTYETAKELEVSVNNFIANPSVQTHGIAKAAWVKAHTTYSQTEVFRFGNPNVDDWEGAVNAWPMDEGMLDYVDDSYQYEDGNPYAKQNIISDQVEINIELIKSMHEKAGSEANVASGYHAIEFLLWGQDLNLELATSGNRSHTDYLQGERCTNEHCDRRAQYLKVVSNLLVQDVSEMVEQWRPEKGSYAVEFLTLDQREQVNRMLLGMGGLSFGELAAERIRVALIANSQEDEQSCFSDTTDLAILGNATAIKNVYLGEYETSSGVIIEGPSLSDLVQHNNPQLNQELITQLKASVLAAEEISMHARKGEYFDQQILSGNKQGNMRLEKMISQLKTQTQTIEKIAAIIVVDA